METIKLTKRPGNQTTIGGKRLMHVLKTLEEGEWAVSIDRWKDKRSNLQNAFMHVCFDKYGEFVGLTAEEAKWELKKRFGINKLIRRSDGSQDLLVRNTSDYTLPEGKTFIDRILQHFEYDCGFIIDPDVRRQYKVDEITGELEEV